MGKRELVTLLSLTSWCLVIVVWLFLAVSWVCLQFVMVVFHDHTHSIFGVRKFLFDVDRKINFVLFKKLSLPLIWNKYVK